MREILFRGKRIDNGQWVFGFYSNAKNGDGRFHYIETEKSHIRVAHETVCQYTGMIDKNGNKIFEGDIIESHSLSGDIARHRIGFDESMGCYIATLLIGRQAGYFFQLNQKWIVECDKVVVGNVYDNPEQTKGGEL